MYQVSLVLYEEDSLRDVVIHWNPLMGGVEIRDAVTIKDALNSKVDSSKWTIGVPYKMGNPLETIHYVLMEPKEQKESRDCRKREA